MTTEELLGLIDEGTSMAERVPPAGVSFATSVSGKLKGIRETVQRTQRATPKQCTAVSNMVGALQKWVEPPTKH